MFTKQTIAILGRGIEGQSTYRFLLAQGCSPANIAIFDKKTPTTLPEGSKAWIGPGYTSHLIDYQVIIRSPGITDHLLQQTIADPGVWEVIAPRLTNQTQLFFDAYQGKVIGITGTKGKSTLCALTYQLLKDTGHDVVLAGNGGQPVLDQIDFAHPPAYVVYELSSFMLESLHDAHIAIGVRNTLYPTHVGEHGGWEPYVHAKSRLLAFSDILLLGSQVQETLSQAFPTIAQQLAAHPAAYQYGFAGKYRYTQGGFWSDTQQLAGGETVRLLGEHNRYNVCALYGIADILGITPQQVQQTTQQFAGLPDRIEHIGTIAGIDRYNDAIATTPQATQAALAALGDRVETLFVGGILGTYDFQGLADSISASAVSTLITFPDSGPLIAQLVKKANIQIFATKSMADAVRFAAAHTAPGNIALLSCGSPSFSLWSSYREKAAQFKDAVGALEHTS